MDCRVAKTAQKTWSSGKYGLYWSSLCATEHNHRWLDLQVSLWDLYTLRHTHIPPNGTHGIEQHGFLDKHEKGNELLRASLKTKQLKIGSTTETSLAKLPKDKNQSNFSAVLYAGVCVLISANGHLVVAIQKIINKKEMKRFWYSCFHSNRIISFGH